MKLKVDSKRENRPEANKEQQQEPPPRLQKLYPRTTLEQIDGNIIRNSGPSNFWASLVPVQEHHLQCDKLRPASPPLPTLVKTGSVAKKKKCFRRSTPRNQPSPADYQGFIGLVAEAILGATDAQGQVLHLVKWEGRDEMDLVPAVFTTVKFPHVVLAYYSNRIRYLDPQSVFEV